MVNEEKISPLDLIIKQLETIAEKIEQLPQIVTSIEKLTMAQRHLEESIKRTIDDLRATDKDLKHSFEDLKVDIHCNQTAIIQAQAEMVGYKTEHLEIKENVKEQLRVANNRIKELEDFVSAWSPWLKVIKWAAIIVGGIVVSFVALALIWGLGQAIQAGIFP